MIIRLRLDSSQKLQNLKQKQKNMLMQGKFMAILNKMGNNLLRKIIKVRLFLTSHAHFLSGYNFRGQCLCPN